MIIRLTVEDNDFGDLMNIFLKKFPSVITKIPSNIENMGTQNQLDTINEIEEIDKLLNPNITEKHTNEEKMILIKRIVKAFSEFVYNYTNEHTAEYLEKRFKVEIVDFMEDKWENGEVWYWFQHSGIFLNQWISSFNLCVGDDIIGENNKIQGYKTIYNWW